MPKRHGNLYPQICTVEALHAAFLRAKRGKSTRPAVMRFEANLGSELMKLSNELTAGTYRPSGYRRFAVNEHRKARIINAPAFRDAVVQHAIYAVLNPLLERRFIHDNYGCRIAKGTHRAADQAQRFLRAAPADSHTLQMDIRKFYYRINLAVLRRLTERVIKDRRFIDLFMCFAELEDGNGIGVPIGNLLAQIQAVLYLNALDHYVKRELKCRHYVRYVDDFIIFGLPSRDAAHELRQKIEVFLADELGLELSRYIIAPVHRGLNFVGFRTWRKTRFVRRHSLHSFSRSLKRGDIKSLVSILGNARQSASYSHFCRRLRTEHPELISQLPESHKNACANLPVHENH